MRYLLSSIITVYLRRTAVLRSRLLVLLDKAKCLDYTRYS